MLQILAVAIGGAIGSVMRYLVSAWAAEKFGTQFPYGTLLVNVAGCFIIGLFLVLATERLALSPYWRLFIASGFLGGLTTFSSFSYETFQLFTQSQFLLAVQNIGINVLAGLTATYLGAVLARAL